MLSDTEIHQFFHKSPTSFSREISKKKLGIALGAVLYMPGLMPNFATKLTNNSLGNLTSLFICLEDAISDSQLTEAENNVIHELKLIEKQYVNGDIDVNQFPLLFLRIRNVHQLQEMASKLGSALHLLTGIVFPKCTSANVTEFFNCLKEINRQQSIRLYALPILETKEIIYGDAREQELNNLYNVFKEFEHMILNIRVGTTDFSSLFSMRRPGERTIYDVKVITDCLVSIINRFSRHEDSFVISGPVFEHFEDGAMLQSFQDTTNIEEVLWNEVQLDVLNGFIGKTCIHPSQVDIVNAAYLVSTEMYDDACLIVGNSNKTNGVLQSPTRNKMNEVKPHYNWAIKMLAQAEIYGVLNENVTSLDFLRYIKSKNI